MEGIHEMRLNTGQGFCKDGPRQATDDQGTASGLLYLDARECSAKDGGVGNEKVGSSFMSRQCVSGDETCLSVLTLWCLWVATRWTEQAELWARNCELRN
jgi:hypothetical protein